METDPPALVELHLHIQVRPGCEDRLVEFLRRARSFYEAPGGIRVRLLRDDKDSRKFVEVIEYADFSKFEADQHRVRSDAAMQAYLTEWKSLLEKEITAAKYVDFSSGL